MTFSELKDRVKEVLEDNRNEGFLTFFDTNVYRPPIINLDGIKFTPHPNHPKDSKYAPNDIIAYCESARKFGFFNTSLGEILREQSNIYFNFIFSETERDDSINVSRVTMNEIRDLARYYKNKCPITVDCDDINNLAMYYKSLICNELRLKTISMDGNIAPIPELDEIKRHYGDEVKVSKDLSLIVSALNRAEAYKANGVEIWSRDRDIVKLGLQYDRKKEKDMPALRIRNPYIEFSYPSKKKRKSVNFSSLRVLKEAA